MGTASQEYIRWRQENGEPWYPGKRPERGLEKRYDVSKVNDPTGKHDECRYFVLDPQHDPLAVEALLTYERAARQQGFHALADDLYAWRTDRVIPPASTDPSEGK